MANYALAERLPTFATLREEIFSLQARAELLVRDVPLYILCIAFAFGNVFSWLVDGHFNIALLSDPLLKTKNILF